MLPYHYYDQLNLQTKVNRLALNANASPSTSLAEIDTTKVPPSVRLKLPIAFKTGAVLAELKNQL